MTLGRRFHPLFVHFDVLLCLAGAGATLVISWLINPHSVAWLVDIYVVTGLLLASLRSARKTPLHRSYAVYLCALSQYLLVVWLLHAMTPGRTPDAIKQKIIPLMRALSLGCVYMSVALYYFTLRFAESKSRILRIIEYAGWIGSTIFYVLLLSGKLMADYIWSGVTWVPAMDATYKIFFYFTTLYVTLGIAIPLYGVVTVRERQRRLQVFYFLLGGIPLWLSCWGHFLISFGINIYPAGGVIFLMHALIMSYAVFKHRVFDITILLRRGLAYAILSLCIGMLYGGSLLILSNWTAALHASVISSLLFIFIAGMLYAPLLNKLQKTVDRFFFRATIDRQRTIEQFALDSATTINLSSLSRSLCDLIEKSLKPRRTTLFLDNGKGLLVQYCSHDGRYSPGQWPNGAQFPQDYARSSRSVSAAYRVRAPEPAWNPQPLQFTEGDDALVVPIVHRDQRLGCLFLEPKRADEPYDEDDIRLAELIAAQSAVALQNARSFAQLEHLQDLNRTMLESLMTGVIVVSSKEVILQSNEAIHSICSVSGEFPSNLRQLQEIHANLVNEIRFLLEGGKPADDIELTIAGVRPRNILLSFRQLTASEGEVCCLIVLHDVTNYKELEAIAGRRESLARIGEAAAGINHEIKNLLHPIRFQMDRLARLDINSSIDVTRELQRTTTVIPVQVKALEKMLRNLKNLGRPLKLRIGKVELESLVGAVWNDITTTREASEILFCISIADDAKEVSADGTWLRHVIHNLLLNAVDATVGCHEPRVTVTARRNGEIFNIQISDNGRGIDEATKKRLFEPFFSTKGEAGTGLGLCVCRRIIESHGGRITVESESGRTAFRLLLPSTKTGSTGYEDPRSSF